jgi:hypothetical protein
MALKRPLVRYADTGKVEELRQVDSVAGAAPAGPVAGTKALVYTDGVLTAVNGPAGATKALTYTDGVLTQVQAFNGGVTTTKTLAYTNGSLTSVETAIT